MTASPTPPDFFAESANKSEHHAESAYCSDHIVDADKMVSAGLPSEEEMTMLVDGAAYYGADPRSVARAILDLIRPAFDKACNANSEGWRKLAFDEHQKLLSAESKLAQAVEAAGEVLKHRVGDLPTAGYLRDNNASRMALAALAQIAAPGAAMEAP